MRFFDFGQTAQGVIAIGQEAVGVIAIGQTAVGVVAIGQMARGVFVVGQLAVGVVAFGQLALGLWWAGGMLAFAGRAVWGLGIAMFPKKEEKKGIELPKTVPLGETSEDMPGWVAIEVRRGPVVLHDGKPLAFECGQNVQSVLEKMTVAEWPRGRLFVRHERRADPAVATAYRENAPTIVVLVAERIICDYPPEMRTVEFWVWFAIRSAGAVLLLGATTLIAFLPLWNGLVSKPLMVPWVDW